MADPAITRLDPENPWPGLDSFGESDSAYFHGRESEIAELLRLVRRESLTVLFGQSGLGKTSLLGAGLFPRLRSEGLLPVLLRVDFSGGGPLPREQVLHGLVEECRSRGVEPPSAAGVESLWEYFHRSDADFWNPKNRPVTPVIAFDQFEEVFTLGQQSEAARNRCRDFLTELGDLIENRPPQHLKHALDDDPGIARLYDFRKADFKLLLSFREDYLAHVEGLKKQIPSLTYNRFRLQPMNGHQAHEVVVQGGGHLVDEMVAARIIGIAAGRDAAGATPGPDDYDDLGIDPALLSVICSELNGRRQRAGHERIGASLISGAEHSILADFYERGMAGLDPRVRVFVEDELLTEKGFRDSYALDDAVERPGISAQAIDQLVARRLLRVDDRFGVRRLELTHDVLTGVVRASRDSRQTREAEAAAAAREAAAARRQRRNRVVSLLLALGFVGVSTAALYVFHLKSQVSVLQVEADRQKAIADERLLAAQQAEARARQAQDEALQEQRRADEATATAQSALAEAEVQQQRAASLKRQNDSTQLLMQARRMQDTDPGLALLLDVEAARLAPSLDVRAGFLNAFLKRPRLAGLLATGDALRAVRYSPDGHLLAAASADHSVRLWDARTRQARMPLVGHTGEVFDIAFSADGSVLASAGADERVLIWDLKTGRQRAAIAAGAKVSFVAFSPDGRMLAASTQRGAVTLWDSASARALPPLEGEADVVTSAAPIARAIAFSPDGRSFAAAGADNTIALWNLSDRRLLDRLSGHREAVLAIAFSPDGKTLASAGDDRTVLLWDVAGRSPLGPPLAGHATRIWGLAFRADGHVLATAGEDRTVVLWDVSRRRRLAVLEGHQDRVNAVAFAPDGRTLASASDDTQVMLWDTGTRADRPELLAQPSPLLGQAHRLPAAAWGMAFSPDGTTVAVASEDRSVLLWDPATGRSRVLAGHADKVNGVAFSPDGRTLASGSDDSQVMLWDVRSGRRLATLSGHADSVHGVAFSADGRRLASASRDGNLMLWDVALRRLHSTLVGTHGWVWAVAFGPDGSTLASASEDGTIVLWSLASGRPRATLNGHRRRVLDIAFSPDGRLLASAGADQRVGLWDAATARRLAWLEQHADEVRAVGFDPAGDVLASASADRSVVLWDVAQRKLIATLEGHGDRVRAVAFSPDGKRLVSAGDDAVAILWTWDLPALQSQACRIANRNLSADERRQYLGDDAKTRSSCPTARTPN